MAVYNISALADRTKYFINTQNMDATQAEQKVFEEAGLTNGAESMPSNVYAEYQKMLANPTTDSQFARNDKDGLIDRNNVGATQNFDLPQAEQQAEQAPPAPEEPQY